MGADNVSSFAVATSAHEKGAPLPVFRAIHRHGTADAPLPCPRLAPLATAPTTGAITPQQADRAWQKATDSYAPAGAALVAKVEEGAVRGPFRPDWPSLRK